MFLFFFSFLYKNMAEKRKGGDMVVTVTDRSLCRKNFWLVSGTQLCPVTIIEKRKKKKKKPKTKSLV
jgi:hypothetical protein